MKLKIPLYINCIPKVLFPKSNNNRNIIDHLNYLTNIIKKQLDVKYLIGKLNNLDKLSYLFFGNDYIHLLETAPNPYIKSNIDNLKKEFVSESNNIINDINKNLKNLLNI